MTLTARPSTGSRFLGWGGGCSGKALTCAVTTSADQSVLGRFVLVPAISRLSVSPTTFTPATTGPSTQSATRHGKRGTLLRFSLNEAATVRFTVQQRLAGRRIGSGSSSRCVAPTKQNRQRPRCTRGITLRGSFTLTGRSGSNRAWFTGRLAGRRLAPGSYALIANPTASGVAGKPATASLRIGA